MIELKPCPFCGGKAIILYYENGNHLYYENGNQYRSNLYYASKRGTVTCEKCRCSLHIYAKAKDAVNAWNRRADKP